MTQNAMRTLLPMPRQLVLATLLVATGIHAQDYVKALGTLVVEGRITDGEIKLTDADAVLFKENVQVERVTTGKNGRFNMVLELNSNYAIEFRHLGFIAKRIAIDTHIPKPKPGQEFDLTPINMSVSLLEHARYNGAPTDDLDFPFALIKLNKKTMEFEQDAEYTMGMQRTNGALLLMAARTRK
jgi:hypothetical protein